MIDLLIIAAIGWSAWSRWGGGVHPFWQDGTPGKPGTPANNDKAMADILRIMQASGLTPEDIARGFKDMPALPPASPRPSAGNVAMRVFTYLGAVFVFGGIGAYISMFWPSMSSGMRIFITLGTGIGLSVLSIIAMKEGKYPRLILPLIILAAIVETGGWFVFTDEMFPRGGDYRKAVCFIFTIMSVQEWLTFAGFRRVSLLFFSLAFTYILFGNALDLLGMHYEYIGILLGGSMFCVSDWVSKSRFRALTEIGFFVGALVFNGGIYDLIGQHVGWHQAAMVTGLSLCGLAYGLKHNVAYRLSGLFYFIGSGIFYGGLFDWVWHTPFELLYLAVAVAMMYGHTLLESRAILVTSTLAILSFIGYYTEEHFVNSVGWPIALILLGVAFLGVGAMAVRIGKRG